MANSILLDVPDDYQGIRTALGFGATDTTNVSQALIESSPYLPSVERMVKRVLTTWATVITGGGDRLEELEEAVRRFTASALAGRYFAARTGEEVAEADLGPARTKWRQGPDWLELARTLGGEADVLLNSVVNWGGNEYVPHELVAVDGATRYHRARGTQLPADYWLELLTPEAVLGRVK